MYEELVKRLRDAAKMSEALAVLLPHSEGNAVAKLHRDAADAIEELQADKAALNDTVTNLLEQIKDLDKPRWISVTERLPEMHEYVLICNDDYGKTELGFSTVAVWDGSDWVNAWDGEGTICCVTHWMPLPEPPKEET